MYQRQYEESGYLVCQLGAVLAIGTTIDVVVDLSTDGRVPMLERASMRDIHECKVALALKYEENRPQYTTHIAMQPVGKT